MSFGKVKLAAILMPLLAAPSASLAEGDLTKGEKLFKRCIACHAVGKKAKNKLGPQLNDVFGRLAGGLEGFRYSKSMIAKGAEENLVWTEGSLRAFLTKPRSFVKGTKMGFGGLKKETDREDIIAYMRQFSSEEAQAAAAKADKDSPIAVSTGDGTTGDEPPPVLTTTVLDDPAVHAKGGEVWAAQCRHCHGNSAYPGKGPKLTPARYKPDFVFERVTNGFRKMPAWKDVFSQEERVAVTAYILSRSFAP